MNEKSIERRNFVRYAITFPVEFAWMSKPDQIVKATAINVSLGGMQIFINGKIEFKGEQLMVRMLLPNKEVIDNVKTQIVHHKSSFDGVFFGLVFLNMDLGKIIILKNYFQTFEQENIKPINGNSTD